MQKLSIHEKREASAATLINVKREPCADAFTSVKRDTMLTHAVRDDQADDRENPLHGAASLMGKKGGPAAAKARFTKMSSEQRQTFGRNLAAARWNKNRAEKAEDVNP